MEKQRENKLVQWLDQLQEQSWNLELIISGFVLFGLFQLREFLIVKIYYFAANNNDFYDTLGLTFGILQISIDIFIFSLLLLVFTRGLWIGAIGLRYVSGSIDYDSFNYSARFKSYLKRKVGDFDDYIQRLEHISSSIFAFTYLLFFISLSLIVFDFQMKSLDYLFFNKLGLDLVANIFVGGFFISASIVFFDFITLGLLKSIKQPLFSRVYSVLYHFFGIITLSFLWRPIWYNFIDQRSTKWIAVFAVPFLIGFIIFKSVVFPKMEYQFFPKLAYKTESGRFSSIFYKGNARNGFQPEFYDDLRHLEREEKNFSTIDIFSISSHRIDVPLIEVFVRYTGFIDEFVTRQDSSLAAINEVGFNKLGNFNILNINIIKR
ncbi:MAG: hypothetical protein AAGI23_21815 [Bacteroidota bacterium]